MKIYAFGKIRTMVFFVLAFGALAGAQSKGPGGPPPPGGFPPPPNPSNQPGAPGPQRHMRRPAQMPSSRQDQPARSGVQFGPVGRWWDDKSVVRNIGLTTDQKRRMDSIFSANKPAILASYQNYLKEQSKLNALNRNSSASQSATFAAIDAVNRARAELEKATAQMYIEIRKQMSPEQIQKLKRLE